MNLAKRKREPYAPLPQGDTGPDTAAQMELAEVIPLHGRGGTFRGKVRRTRLDMMAKPYGRRRHAQVTPRQRNAGNALYEVALGTETSKGTSWAKVYVDTSPKPGDKQVEELEARARYEWMLRQVPRHCLAIVKHVAVYQGGIRPGFTNDAERADQWLECLKEGLDALADALRI